MAFIDESLEATKGTPDLDGLGADEREWAEGQLARRRDYELKAAALGLKVAWSEATTPAERAAVTPADPREVRDLMARYDRARNDLARELVAEYERIRI